MKTALTQCSGEKEAALTQWVDVEAQHNNNQNPDLASHFVFWREVADKNYTDMLIKVYFPLKGRIDDLAKERSELEGKLKVLRGDGEGCE